MKSFEELNRKHKLMIVIAFGLIFTATIACWIADAIKANKENFDLEINGTIQYVDYDMKGFPKMTVHGKIFYIGSGYHVEHQIEAGDSLVKKKGSTIYKLIKHGSGVVIEFKKTKRILDY